MNESNVYKIDKYEIDINESNVNEIDNNEIVWEGRFCGPYGRTLSKDLFCQQARVLPRT